MSPVSPKPCNIRTAGPWPPTRTWIVASGVLTSAIRKLAGNGWTAATATPAMPAQDANTIRHIAICQFDDFMRAPRAPANRGRRLPDWQGNCARSWLKQPRFHDLRANRPKATNRASAVATFSGVAYDRGSVVPCTPASGTEDFREPRRRLWNLSRGCIPSRPRTGDHDARVAEIAARGDRSALRPRTFRHDLADRA